MVTGNINRIIQLAWHDKTSFDEIKRQFYISEDKVIKIMLKYLKPQSFQLWRKRVSGRRSKHQKKSKLLTQYENYKVHFYEVY